MSPVGTSRQSLAEAIASDNVRKQRAMLLSIGTALTLTVIKLIAALLTGSVAVLSEAVHSMTDLIAAGIVWYSLRHAAHPPDSRHRYGHEKLEDVSAVAEGTIIIAAVGYVMFRAIEQLVLGADVQSPLIAMYVMAFSAIANAVVALHLRKVGTETESAGVLADSQQLFGDVFTSAAVGIGLLLVSLTGWEPLDPLVAIGVSLFVLRIGVRLIVGSTRVLLDEALPRHEIDQIEQVLAQNFEGVAGFHRLRTRRAGSRRHVDLHITVDGMMPLYRAHEIAHRVEQAIEHKLRNVDVLTHLEPDTEQPPAGADHGPSDR